MRCVGSTNRLFFTWVAGLSLTVSACRPQISYYEAAGTESPLDPPSALSWLQSSPSGSTQVTANWTPSTSPRVRVQKIQLFSDDHCAAPIGDAIELLTGSTSSYSTSLSLGQTYTYRLLVEDQAGSSLASVCSAPLTLAQLPPHAPLALSCTGTTCTLTPANPLDPNGDAVTYLDEASTCADTVINSATGNASFSLPAKGSTCVVKVKATDGALFSPAITSAVITGPNATPSAPVSVNCGTTPLAGSSGNTCTLTPASPADTDGDTVTYMDGGGTCPSTVVNPVNGSTTFTAPAKGATCFIKIKSFDGLAYSGPVNSATITGQNNSPATPSSLTCPVSPGALSANNSCTLSPAGPADPDGDAVSYVDDGSTCADTSVTPLTGAATFTAPSKGATCLIKIRSFDGSAYSSQISSAPITGANNVPNPPAALACATNPLAGSAGNACTLTPASPTDADGDSVSYSDAASTCANVIVNSSNGNATFTAPAKDATCQVSIKAGDGTGFSTAVASAVITGANNAPAAPSSISCPTSPAAASLGNTCALTPAGTTDLDSDSISYALDAASTCASAVIDDATGTVTFTAPDKDLTCVVKVKAYDGIAYSGIVSSAVITGANRAPNLPNSLSCPASPAASSAGNICTLVAASPADPDGDAVTYSDDASTCAATTVDPSTGAATFTAPNSGATCVIRVKAGDGAAFSSALAATIGGSNNPPAEPAALSCSTTPAAGSAGNACSLTPASPTDPDGDTVSYADGGSTCTVTSLNATSGAVIFTAPAKDDTCVIKLKAFDGQAYSTVLTSATITGQNSAPNPVQSVACTPAPAASSTGNTCILTPAAMADADGDPVTYYKDVATTCLSVSVSTDGSTITFKAPAKGASCVVAVKAYDGTAYSGVVSSNPITGANVAPNTPVALNCPVGSEAGTTGLTCSLSPASPADPDGDTVSYVDDGSTCPSTSINSTTGEATFDVPPTKDSSCTITLKAYDGTAYSGTRTSAAITAFNNAPSAPASVTCPGSASALSTGNVCTLTPAASVDADGDTVTYSDAASTCTDVIVNSASGAATFTAPVKGGSCVITIRAFDGTNYSGSTSSATITAANNPPAIPQSLSCTASPIAASTGNPCTLTAASPPDADSDPVTYFKDASTTCPSASVSTDGLTITFTAPAKATTCIVAVKAYDGTAYSSPVSSATITGQNNAPNTPQSLTCAMSPAGGSTGQTCTLTAASPADADSDPITYEDGGSTCDAVVINPGNGNATFTAPAKSATCVVKVKAFDSMSYSDAVSSAPITGANNAPNTPAALTCTTTSCTLTAANPVDPDTGDTVTYFDNGSSCTGVAVNATTGAASFTEPAKGASCVIKVSASDGALSSAAVSSSAINGPNHAPNSPASVSCNTAPYAASTLNACTLTAAVPADPDGVDTITYANDGSTCLNVVVNSATGSATYTAPAVGVSCVVSIKAYDGTVYSAPSSSGTITAVAVPVADATKSMVTLAPASLKNDGTSTTTVTVTLKDSSGNAVPVAKSVSISLSNANATISGSSTLTTNGSGIASFTVRAGVATGTTQITITDTTDSITLSEQPTLFLLAATPRVEYQAGLAASGRSAGLNSPLTAIWKDLASSTVTNDGALVGYTNSGWSGSGTAASPYELAFNGTGQYVDFTSAVNDSANFSFETWVKPTSATNLNRFILGNGDAANHGFVLKQHSTARKLALTLGTGATALCASTSSLTDGIWNHVAGTFDAAGPTLKLYVNGRLECTNTNATYVYTGSGNSLRAGAANPAANYFPGSISEIRAYDEALSATAVLANFNLKAAKYPVVNTIALSAAPASVTADGNAAATITITVKDSLGNPVSGFDASTITLASTGTNNTITQATGLTNASGQATATMKSTSAETKTISVTAPGYLAGGATAVVTFTSAPVTSVYDFSTNYDGWSLGGCCEAPVIGGGGGYLYGSQSDSVDYMPIVELKITRSSPNGGILTFKAQTTPGGWIWLNDSVTTLYGVTVNTTAWVSSGNIVYSAGTHTFTFGAAYEDYTISLMLDDVIFTDNP